MRRFSQNKAISKKKGELKGKGLCFLSQYLAYNNNWAEIDDEIKYCGMC